MPQHYMTLGESRRRYGRPVLTTEKPEDQIWECEERFRYYSLLYKNIEAQLEKTDLSIDEFNELYTKLLEAEQLRESYGTESCFLQMAESAKNF